jgi:hypothetical protein
MITDPLSVLRKSARLWENRAATEQSKGESANMEAICEAMQKASDVTAQIIELEQRLGIKHEQEPTEIEVYLISGWSCCPQCGHRASNPERVHRRETMEQRRERDKAETARGIDPRIKGRTTGHACPGA